MENNLCLPIANERLNWILVGCNGCGIKPDPFVAGTLVAVGAAASCGHGDEGRYCGPAT